MRKRIVFCCVLGILLSGNLRAETPGQETPSFSLEQCIESTLENNQWRPASQLAVDIAKAQHKQALSLRWPQMDLKSSVMHMDEPMNFLFPSQSFLYELNSPQGSISIPIALPEMDIKLMDSSTILNSVSLTYPLYIGGLRPAICFVSAKFGPLMIFHEERFVPFQAGYIESARNLVNELSQLGSSTGAEKSSVRRYEQ